MWIGAPVVPHGHGLSAPDQFRAAAPEVPPAADGEIARLAIARAIPSFHRQDTKTIADPDVADLKGTRQWRGAGRSQIAIETKRDALGSQVPGKRVGRAHRRHARVPRVAHT